MIITKTPLRISFVGGGSDLKEYYEYYNGGVISATIDKFVYVIIKERFDQKIIVNYTKREVVNNIDSIKHDLVRETLRKTGIKKGIEIMTPADIPSEGSGLGSSSSLTVGLLNALYAHQGIQVTAQTLAEQACEIEIDILGKPIGKQDQYSSAYGGLNKITFKSDNSVEIKPLNIERTERLLLGSNLILHFTGITRDSKKILNEQRINTKKKISELSILVGFISVLEQALNEKRFDELGIFLKKSWELKKNLSSGITRDEIDEMIEVSNINGAIGCKIAGAGGGGFLLSYVPRENQNNFRKAMEKYTELPFMLDPFGSRVIFNIREYNAKF